MTYKREQQPAVSSAKGTPSALKRGLLPGRSIASNAFQTWKFAVLDEDKSCFVSLQEPLTGNNPTTNSPAEGIISRHFPETPAVTEQEGGAA